MDLYTLNPYFLPKDVIDQYSSVVWTERYSAAGEMQLVTAATAEMVDKLAEGTFLALRGSREVMEIQTQSIEKGVLTVVGKSLLAWLDNRLAWFRNYADSASDSRVIDYTVPNSEDTDPVTPGVMIASVVDAMVIEPASFPDGWDDADLEWDNDKIPHLTLGDVDETGTAERLTISLGPLYSSIQRLAEDKNMGISLYLESADPIAGYSLKFTVYRGKDRTSSQEVNPLVKLSPDLESLTEIKELRSIDSFKNVCYVYYKGKIYPRLADPESPAPEGLARRILLTDAEGEPVGHKVTVYRTGNSGRTFPGYPVTVVDDVDITAFVDQNAKDALAQHNYIRAIDGQSSPISDYKYGTDYGLGDLIELVGLSGIVSKARVTEYIRTQDNTGEKGYPTITVVS